MQPVLDENTDLKCVILDIEGTTTAISFVKDILFPYIRKNLKKYLETHWEEEQCQGDVQALREQSINDSEEKKSSADKLQVVSPKILSNDENLELTRQSVVDYVLFLMDADRKVTSLKQLQGHMWKQAYSTGKVVGQIFEDVLPAIKHWISERKKVYIYSSGSVEAQKLLFGHTAEGSILEFISGHFDTKIGAKVEVDSYCKIAKEIGCKNKEILFLTDVTREARPAKEAGCQVAVVLRPGNAPLSDEEIQEFPHISSFSELYAEGSGVEKAKLVKK
ncbi:enolase-phosphatase E1-like [Antedon mediterranea]|uniref:enolase-phosphatase E1-like n=1 Tax=Antedon mediterranea TaxID=105859 RepID=UPI003AF75C13